MSNARGVHSRTASQEEWARRALTPPDEGKAAVSVRACRVKRVDMDEVVESLMAQQDGDGQVEFREPLPLSQLVDILVDFWEAEGLFD